MPIDTSRPFLPVNIAVLTVSDTRTEADDRSGAILVQRLTDADHRSVAKGIVPDEIDRIEARLRAGSADPTVDAVLTTGGTGVTGRDTTPEAVQAVVDKGIPGFGELFRWLSFQTIGTSTIQSRAMAGVADGTCIFTLPGSTGACKDAWDGILSTQLDSRFRPCDFVEPTPRLEEWDETPRLGPATARPPASRLPRAVTPPQRRTIRTWARSRRC
jgi:molybdenum cofactor biosynthesis protein B